MSGKKLSLPERFANVAAGLVLLCWMIWIYAYWWGWINANTFNVHGPIKAAFVIFGIPILCILILGLINRPKW